jgi:hypothetical protein
MEFHVEVMLPPRRKNVLMILQRLPSPFEIKRQGITTSKKSVANKKPNLIDF